MTDAVIKVTALRRSFGAVEALAGLDLAVAPGRVLGPRHPNAARRLIGLAGQAAAVDEALTGRENLALIARLGRLPGREIAARAAALPAEFNLAADRPARGYSGGMRRRLDLASRPAVLLLDEPTTGARPPS